MEKRVILGSLIVLMVFPMGLVLSGSSLAELEGTNTISATTIEMEWEHTFGGIDHDRANALIQTADGGFVIAGNTYSYGAGKEDFWLIKVLVSGDTTTSQTTAYPQLFVLIVTIGVVSILRKKHEE